MTRFLALALVVATSGAACSKSDAPAPAAKAAPSEAAKAGATAAQPTPAAGAATTPAVPPGRPASITDAQLAAINKLVSAVDDLGKGLASASDCKEKVMMLKLSALEIKMTLMDPEMTSMLSQADADSAVKTWFDATFKPRMEAAAIPLKTSAEACKDDPEFMTTLATVPMMKKKS
jgi:hypothetical protein